MEMSYRKRILVLGTLVLSVVIGYTAYAYPKNDDSEYCTGDNEMYYMYEKRGLCVVTEGDSGYMIPDGSGDMPIEMIRGIVAIHNITDITGYENILVD